MKHSSHQIRGKCTYHFALEPGITAWQSPVATPVGGSAAAASLGPRLGRERRWANVNLMKLNKTRTRKK